MDKENLFGVVFRALRPRREEDETFVVFGDNGDTIEVAPVTSEGVLHPGTQNRSFFTTEVGRMTPEELAQKYVNGAFHESDFPSESERIEYTREIVKKLEERLSQ